MKTRILSLLVPTFVLAAALSARGDDKKDGPAQGADTPSRRVTDHIDKDDGRIEKSPVTFLGVETAPASPVLASQLGLAGDTGLVVLRVAGESPASAVLKQHDVLTKFDDQILVDSRQLSVLVRAHKEGDEVALTLVRAGKEQTLKVKLGKHDLPRVAGFGGFGPGGQDQFFRSFNNGDSPEEMPLGDLPGLAREDVDNVMRMIGREHGNWFAAPPMHVFNHGGGKGSTVLNLADGNFVFSDESGSVEVNASNGKRELTVKNPKGEVTFKGPINNGEDHKKLPPEVVARLDKIEKMDVGYEPGADFEQDATAIKPADKTKISAPPAALREVGPRARSF